MKPQLDPKCFGFACGTAAAFFYLGCVLLMGIAGHEALVAFFNGILHGIDVAPILQPHLGFWLTVLGFIDTFILSWLFGALVAVLYNGALLRVSTKP